MSNILDLMYVSLINIIITSISTQLPGFVAWIRRQYNIIINFLLDNDTINKFIADNFSNESNANQTWNPMPIAKLYAYKILYSEKKRFVEELEKYSKTLINQ